MGARESRPSSSESNSSDEDSTQTGRPTYEQLWLIVREAMQRTQREIEQKKLAEKNIERKETDEASVDGNKNYQNTKRKLIKDGLTKFNRSNVHRCHKSIVNQRRIFQKSNKLVMDLSGLESSDPHRKSDH